MKPQSTTTIIKYLKWILHLFFKSSEVSFVSVLLMKGISWQTSENSSAWWLGCWSCKENETGSKKKIFKICRSYVSFWPKLGILCSIVCNTILLTGTSRTPSLQGLFFRNCSELFRLHNHLGTLCLYRVTLVSSLRRWLFQKLRQTSVL